MSDEAQEAACRPLLPRGAWVRVTSDSGGHHSGYTAARDGCQALLAALAAGEVAAIAVSDLSRLARNRLMLDPGASAHHECSVALRHPHSAPIDPWNRQCEITLYTYHSLIPLLF